MDSLLPSDPSSIDGYVIEGRLGSGGFGIVYAATSPDGVPVAVKVLRPELSDDPRLRDRLAREADALSRVEGERTAEIFKVVTDGDLVYLVMERVEGESLTDQVNDSGALSGPMLWFAAAGLVQALQDIHAAGLVHRDLKPSNVMYGPDGVKVLDFGISVVADETALTQTGAFVGTGAWMAPEMVLGNDVTEKTDVYALGLVLAFIALGRHPFGEGRADALMYRIANTDPDLDGMSEPFLGAVSMCLQRDPDDRPGLEELAGFFGSNGEQQLSATSIVGSDAGGTRIVQPAVAAASGGGNKKRNVLIGASIVAAAAVVGIIVGVTGGGGGGDDPPELADAEDTQLQSEEVAFVQDDEEEPGPVEADEEEPAEEEQPTPEPVTEEAEEEPVAEEETVVEEEPAQEDTEAEQEAVLVALLTDTYEWGSASASKTMMLQEALAIPADGSYGAGTRQAHLNALQERGLTITNVPDEPTSTAIIGCSLDVETAEYPTLKIRIDFTNGTPEDYWLQVYMSSQDGQVTPYGPSDQVISGTNRIIDLSAEAQGVLPLNRLYVSASTLGEATAWEGNPPHICVNEFFFEEFEEPAPPVFQSTCSISDRDLSYELYLISNVPPPYQVTVATADPLPDATLMPPFTGELSRAIEIEGVEVQSDGPITIADTGGVLNSQDPPAAAPGPGETVSWTDNATVTIEWDTPNSGQLYETFTCSNTTTFTRP
ncbi:MAG: serine/threonine-protein kinase [Actinomycetota bacterium]